MTRRTPRRAKVIAAIDPARVDVSVGDGSSMPQIGDIVDLDHGFTGPNGESMGIVYCTNSDGSTRWGADVYDSEIELLP